jgi:hypothetical protein
MVELILPCGRMVECRNSLILPPTIQLYIVVFNTSINILNVSDFRVRVKSELGLEFSIVYTRISRGIFFVITQRWFHKQNSEIYELAKTDIVLHTCVI